MIVMGTEERFESYFYKWFEKHPEVKVVDENDVVQQIMPKYGLLRHNEKADTLFTEPDARFLNGR